VPALNGEASEEKVKGGNGSELDVDALFPKANATAFSSLSNAAGDSGAALQVS
jgi:hypothetical protein